MAVVASGILVLILAEWGTDGGRVRRDWGLNGTYVATSNGQWAQTNDIYRDEASVRSNWTISTTCSTPLECTGRVSSDLGWSADVGIHGSEYVVKRDLPNWEPCPDGTARTGHQIYRFYPVDEKGWFSWVQRFSPASTRQSATAVLAASTRRW